MVAVVGVQHDITVPGEIVLLAPEATTVRIDVGIDVSVVEDERWKGSVAFRHIHDAGDGQPATAIRHEIARVAAVLVEHVAQFEPTAVVSLLDQCLDRHRVRRGGGR